MNKEQTKAAQHAEVLLAFAAGKKIENCRKLAEKKDWFYTSKPTWDFSALEYREAVEPLELWVNVYEDGSYGSSYETKADAEEHRNEQGKTILLREVTDA